MNNVEKLNTFTFKAPCLERIATHVGKAEAAKSNIYN